MLAAYDAAHVGPPGEARKLIEEAPAVAVPEWISVKRQRPRYEEKVLFADLVGEVHFATDSLDWDDGHVVFYVPALDKWLRGDMWMPMPEPPKGGGGK